MSGSARTLVITGASTGIGRACAVHFSQRGFRVFAGVRKIEDGEALKAEAPGVTPLILDVTDREAVARAAEAVSALVGDAGLDGLVNNAGIAVNGPLEYIPLERIEAQFAVNVVGTMAVTLAFLPLLRKARGRIVNISSESGRFVLPLVGPYAASKHAVEALSDALRVELLPDGIKVVLIEPGSIKTAIWDKVGEDTLKLIETIPAEGRARYQRELKANLKVAQNANKMAIPASRVVRAVDKALTSRWPAPRYLVGLEAWVLTYVLGSLPTRLADRVLSAGVRSMGRLK